MMTASTQATKKQHEIQDQAEKASESMTTGTDDDVMLRGLGQWAQLLICSWKGEEVWEMIGAEIE